MRTQSESESKAILTHSRIPVVEGRMVDDPVKAVAAAREMGHPVVLKVSHPELAHKSDAGGVLLGVSGDDGVRAGCERLLGLRDGARVVVERQAEDGGVDLICGLKRDPVFGPAVMVGLGGIYAELFKDTALHVGSISREEAVTLVGTLDGSALLAGTRGRPCLDVEGVADVLVALSELGQSRPDLAELDVNPLRVYEDEVLALDALAVVDEPGLEPSAGPASPPSLIDNRIAPFFAPRSVAVVGASTTKERAGNIIIKNMRTLGFRGAIYPVNPSGAEVEGLPSFCTVKECPGPVELAVLAIPYTQVDKVIRDVRDAGVSHVIVVTGGFSDAGRVGKEREERLVEFCREAGIHLMGPNSIGPLDSRSGFTTSIGKLPPVPATGIAIIGQSGTLSTGYTLEEVTWHGHGFGKVVCLGNKPDVVESDFLEFLGRDPDTSVLGMYVEAVNDGPRFFAAARAAARRKPVVVVKSGRTETGAQAAASHTGSLAGEDAVYDAVFRQAGIQRAASLEEMTGLLRTFDMCPLPRSNRIGIVSLTGVGCVLAADACGQYGLKIAPLSAATRKRLDDLAPGWATITNPADIWSTIEQRGPADSFLSVGEAFIADDSVDMVLFISVLLEEGAFDAGATLRPLVQKWPHKPVLACFAGARNDLHENFRKSLHAIRIPVFSQVDSAVHAAAALWRRAQDLQRESDRD